MPLLWHSLQNAVMSCCKFLVGGRVDNIPGLDGNFAIQIPEGTENGSSFKLEGKAMPRFGDERGDEYVVVKLSLPKGLAEEEKTLLRQFERLRMLHLDRVFLSEPSFGFPALPCSRNEAAK